MSPDCAAVAKKPPCTAARRPLWARTASPMARGNRRNWGSRETPLHRRTRLPRQLPSCAQRARGACSQAYLSLTMSLALAVRTSPRGCDSLVPGGGSWGIGTSSPSLVGPTADSDEDRMAQLWGSWGPRRSQPIRGRAGAVGGHRQAGEECLLGRFLGGGTCKRRGRWGRGGARVLAALKQRWRTDDAKAARAATGSDSEPGMRQMIQALKQKWRSKAEEEGLPGRRRRRPPVRQKEHDGRQGVEDALRVAQERVRQGEARDQGRGCQRKAGGCAPWASPIPPTGKAWAEQATLHLFAWMSPIRLAEGPAEEFGVQKASRMTFADRHNVQEASSAPRGAPVPWHAQPPDSFGGASPVHAVLHVEHPRC